MNKVNFLRKRGNSDAIVNQKWDPTGTALSDVDFEFTIGNNFEVNRGSCGGGRARYESTISISEKY